MANNDAGAVGAAAAQLPPRAAADATGPGPDATPNRVPVDAADAARTARQEPKEAGRDQPASRT